MVFGTGRMQEPGAPERRDTTAVPALPPAGGAESGESFAPSGQPDSVPPRSMRERGGDSTAAQNRPIRIASDSTAARDTTRKAKPFLDDIVRSTNKDSLIYDLKNNKVYIYTEGDVTYQNLNLKGDYLEIDLATKNVYGFGYVDSLGNKTRPEFSQDGKVYTMDTLTYNLETKRAKIKGAATKEGDGFLTGTALKKMEDNTVNIFEGKYSTCDHLEHQHFYLAMTKAKLIPGKKVIVGPSFLVLENVPLYILPLPFGFFPITQGRSSGVIMPTFGEETRKGFFLREGGYYWAVNDYMDLALRGGYYTLGSWEANLSTRYIKRYRYTGDLSFDYVQSIIGEKGDDDYVNGNSLKFTWQHRQDPKFRPNSQFSANVTFMTQGYSNYGTNSMADHLQTQTSSNITYSKSWAGKPFTFSANIAHSQSTNDNTYSFTLPNLSFNVSRLFPFKGKNFVGKEKWYHKINFTYGGTLQNRVTVKESEMFSEKMLKNMQNGVSHSIPVNASFTVLNYLNLTPNFRYNEQWHFRKIDQRYDYDQKKAVNVDTTYGFYRTYDYSFGVSADTRVYGQFDFIGKDPVVKAIRHVMDLRTSFSYAPDFSKSKYGFFKPIQTDSTGRIGTYTPYTGNAYTPRSGKESMSMNFSLGNTLEAKVRNDKDTSGFKKLKIFDRFNISSAYDFMRDSMKLSDFNVDVGSQLIPNFGINVNMAFSPYQLSDDGHPINKFMVSKGSLARLTRLSTSFGYTFGPGASGGGQGGYGAPAMNDFNHNPTPDPQDRDFFNRNNIDPATQRAMLTGMYYDFNIPWSLNVGYDISYTKPGKTTTITQTLRFNASVNLTPKWGLTWNAGYDLEKGELTPGTFYITRDLHCWQMNLMWVPTGMMQQWAFNISVKSNVLRDLKYDRRSSRYDRLYDN